MNKTDNCPTCHVGFCILVALFGVFFLVANLSPDTKAVLAFWPIFLIAAGILKAVTHYFRCWRS